MITLVKETLGRLHYSFCCASSDLSVHDECRDLDSCDLKLALIVSPDLKGLVNTKERDVRHWGLVRC